MIAQIGALGDHAFGLIENLMFVLLNSLVFFIFKFYEYRFQNIHLAYKTLRNLRFSKIFIRSSMLKIYDTW